MGIHANLRLVALRAYLLRDLYPEEVLMRWIQNMPSYAHRTVATFMVSEYYRRSGLDDVIWAYLRGTLSAGDILYVATSKNVTAARMKLVRRLPWDCGRYIHPPS